MSMPNNLVLVRHGESEGNVLKHLSKHGDESLFTDEVRSRHGSTFHLTELGRQQAQQAGKWIQENIGTGFQRYYTSEYVRARETAGLLGLSNAQWLPEFYLRERDWGEMDVCPESEKKEKFSEAMRRRDIQPFYWAPPSGESLADLCIRVDRVIDTLHRECAGETVIIVCHGEVMWAFRARLERMSQERFLELDASTHPYDRIHNCQILHYTRINPEDHTDIRPYLLWMRSVCPTDLILSSNIWQPIIRKKYSNEELFVGVSQYPHIIS